MRAKTTDDKIVKHISQCSYIEKEAIAKRLKQFKHINSQSKHSREEAKFNRFTERTGEDMHDIYPYINVMLQDVNNVKEVSIKDGGKKVRVLMKSKFVIHGKKDFYLFFVVSLDKGNLVTVIPVPATNPNHKEKIQPHYSNTFNVAEYLV